MRGKERVDYADGGQLERTVGDGDGWSGGAVVGGGGGAAAA